MKEKLIIKNFGPIKSVELELGRVTVLIGEQATGKSTVAKVLAVCRYFSYLVGNDLFSGDSFGDGILSWGLNEFTYAETYIYYECKHYTLTVTRTPGALEILDDKGKIEDEVDVSRFSTKLTPISSEFKALLDELGKIRPKASEVSWENVDWSIPTSFYQNDVAKVMDNPFYFPAERGLQSIFSLGKASIQNISDSLFNQLARLDQIARLFKKDTLIEPLDITYKNVDGRGYIRKNTETEFYSLFNAATGYQSTIPVVLVYKYYNEIRRKAKTFIVEEPELDLFPTAQNRVINYLVDQTMNYNNNLLITTHSPYTLTSINNLIYAYKTGQTYKTEVNELLPEKYWLNPGDVSAYRLMSDGTAKDIIDKDLNEIAIEEIDEVGKYINNVYDRILGVKFQKNEKSG